MKISDKIRELADPYYPADIGNLKECLRDIADVLDQMQAAFNSHHHALNGLGTGSPTKPLGDMTYVIELGNGGFYGGKTLRNERITVRSVARARHFTDRSEAEEIAHQLAHASPVVKPL